MSNETTTQDAMELAHEIIDSHPEESPFGMCLAAMAIVSIITWQVGKGDLAIRVGRTLIYIGESENANANAKASN